MQDENNALNSSVPKIHEIVEGLKDVPEEWPLTPVVNKKAYRISWQTEEPLSRQELEKVIKNGDKVTNKKGKPYTKKPTGYGLRLGNGLIAFDVDGLSAHKLLMMLLERYDLVEADPIESAKEMGTVAWTSNKPGRYQLLYKLPKTYLQANSEWLKGSTNEKVTQAQPLDKDGNPCNFECNTGEAIEIRYNGSQSVLPPSKHPDTGRYEWITQPAQGVKRLPDNLKEVLTKHCKPKTTNNKFNKKTSKQTKNNGALDNLFQSLRDMVGEVTPEVIYGDIENNRRNCPIHEGDNKTSLWIDPESKGYYCHSCEEEGDAIDFLWWYVTGRTDFRTASYLENVPNIEAMGQFLIDNGQVSDDRKHSFDEAIKLLRDETTTESLGEIKTAGDAGRYRRKLKKANNEEGLYELRDYLLNNRGKIEEKDEGQLKGVIEQIDKDLTPDKKSKKELLRYVRKKLNLQYNELTKHIEMDSEKLTSQPDLFLLDKHNIEVGKDMGYDIFMYVAQENTYHPVRNYLQHCEQNVTPIDISQLATKYLGTNHWLFDRFVMRFLVACVARVMNPGCKVDDVLILQGEQGIGKTSFFELLGGQWFDGSMGDGSDKDDFLKLHQSWIQEWGELDRITGRKQVGEIKHFLSLSKDTFREPYGRTTDEYPRHTVIVGSVNDAQFLNDPTGDRRFWVIPVPQNIDTEAVKRDRDALWAEAVRLYRSGEQWWLTDEEKTASSDNNEQFRLSDDWETIIENYLKRDGEPKSVSDIAENCFNLQPNELDKNTQIRIGKICRKLGAESKRIRHGKSKITAHQLEPTEQELEEMEKKAGMK